MQQRAGLKYRTVLESLLLISLEQFVLYACAREEGPRMLDASFEEGDRRGICTVAAAAASTAAAAAATEQQ